MSQDTNERTNGHSNGGHQRAVQHAEGRRENGGREHGGWEHGSHGDTHGQGSEHRFDLAGAALDAMHEAGFRPEFGAGVAEELAEIEARFAVPHVDAGVQDLRGMGWSSIDNDTSKDLDQIEVAERVAGGIRLRVAIGDVAAAVAKGSAIDRHAQAQTQTIYTAVRNFPMLPLELSTGLTSLNEDGDRRAVMMSFTVGPDGAMSDERVSLAVVRNRAQLAYSRVGPWLEEQGAGIREQGLPVEDGSELRSDSARQAESRGGPTLVGDSAAAEDGAPGRDGAPGTLAADWLVEQLRMQDEAAQTLHAARVKAGALEFHKAEADPVVMDGRIVGVHEVVQNRAMNLIEDLMVAANGVMARALRAGGRSGLQRVVRIPARWDRIVALAAQHGWTLPAAPDSVELNNFLEEQRRTDSVHYPDLAVAVIKLMGPGEYMLMRADDDPTGHFGLAARDYTHSTAPNRRFPDLVTQRVLHAMMRGEPAPYSDAELSAIALHCNQADTALRKIERDMQKRVAAVAMASRIGEVFQGVVTGSSDKGIYVRVIQPPFEGRVLQGGDGLDVGDKVSVKLIHTDPARAFIDFTLLSRRAVLGTKSL